MSVHVEGWFSDATNEVLYSLVSLADAPERAERIEVTPEEMARAEETGIPVHDIVMERMRQAVERLRQPAEQKAPQ